jgi:hypothetical protein
MVFLATGEHIRAATIAISYGHVTINADLLILPLLKILDGQYTATRHHVPTNGRMQ